MVNDIKIPDFNLDTNFSIDGDNSPKKAPPKKTETPPEPPKEEGKAPATKAPVAEAKQGESPVTGKPKEEPATSKPKPKLLFEEEDAVEFVNSPAVKADSKDKPSKAELKKLKEEKKKAEKPPKPPKPEKPKKERKPINKWVLITPLVVILLGGMIYFFYSVGFFNTLMFQVARAKNRILATNDSRVADSIKKATEMSLYESQFLRQNPESEKSKEEEKQKTKTTTKPETTKPATTTIKSEATKSAKPETTTPTKPVATTSTKPTTTTPTKPTTTTSAKPATTTPTKPANTATTSPGKYSIQVCAWQTESAAQNEVRKIATTGLVSRVVSVDIPKRGTWYRVMVGSYSTETQARGDLNRIMRITGYENCLVREN